MMTKVVAIETRYLPKGRGVLERRFLKVEQQILLEQKGIHDLISTRLLKFVGDRYLLSWLQKNFVDCTKLCC